MLALESADSIRFLYRHFLSKISDVMIALCRLYRITGEKRSLGYRMWLGSESKLKLAASMVRQIMPELFGKKNVIILCDSWYVKKDLVCLVDEYENLDLIGNARTDSVIYDLAPELSGKRAGQRCMEESCPSGMISYCRMKKSVTILWLHAGYSQMYLAKGRLWHT